MDIVRSMSRALVVGIFSLSLSGCILLGAALYDFAIRPHLTAESGA